MPATGRMKPRSIEPLPPPELALRVTRWQAGSLTEADDWVAEELPVELRFGAAPYVVMMATPSDIEDLAVGFALGEGLVSDVREILEIDARRTEHGLRVDVSVPGERLAAILRRRRNLTGWTGCGICGTERLEDVLRQLPVLPLPRDALSPTHVQAALGELAARQCLGARSGALHAAGWVGADGELALLREDVGRHNALDKLVGALARAGTRAGSGFFVVTSRASFEMVQKTVAAGVVALVAMSAPTALAVRLAREAGLTLIAFAREGRHVVYAPAGHPVHLPETG